jgi:hypothetical protein
MIFVFHSPLVGSPPGELTRREAVHEPSIHPELGATTKLPPKRVILQVV